MAAMKEQHESKRISGVGTFTLASRVLGRVRPSLKGLFKTQRDSTPLFRTAQRYASFVKPGSPLFWGILALLLGCIAAKSQGALELAARNDAPSLVLLKKDWVSPLLANHHCKEQKEGWGTPLRETLPPRTQIFVERGRVLFRERPLDASWSVWRCPGLKSPSPDSMGEALPSGLPGLHILGTLLPGPLTQRERKPAKLNDPLEIRY